MDLSGLVVFFVAVVLVGLAISAISRGRAEDATRKHESMAPRTCGRLFSGEPQVVYKSPDFSGGLSLETLVRYGSNSGYVMSQERGEGEDRTVVFTRTSTGRSV